MLSMNGVTTDTSESKETEHASACSTTLRKSARWLLSPTRRTSTDATAFTVSWGLFSCELSPSTTKSSA